MRERRWWMLGVTCLSVVVVSLDLTVLNVALPKVSVALHAGTGDLQWLVDAYSLAFSAVILIAGVVGDRVGRKRVLLAGLAVFLVASVWCALSVSAGELVAARAVMGLGGGIVFPLSLAVVPSAFGDEERQKAIGILTAGVAFGLPLGPVIGGVLLQHFSWNSVFWVNVPVAGLTLIAELVLMPESRSPERLVLDVPGALLSTAAIVAAVWGFIEGPEQGWTSAATLGLLAGAVVLFVAFVLRERGTTDRLIDPALFRDRRFSSGTGATVAVSVALFGLLFFFPQYLQSVVGDDPFSAGLRLVPMMGGVLVGGGLSDPIVKAAGAKLTVAAGLTLLAVGLGVLSQVHLSTGYGLVAVGLGLCGLGIGASISAAMSAVMSAVMAAVGGDEAGMGASLNSALRQVGGAITVAVPGSVMSSTYAGDLGHALTGLPAQDAAAARGSITEVAQIASHLRPGGAALHAAAGAAFLHGLSTVMVICAAVAVIAIPVSLRYLPGHAATDTTPSPQPQSTAIPHAKSQR